MKLIERSNYRVEVRLPQPGVPYLSDSQNFGQVHEGLLEELGEIIGRLEEYGFISFPIGSNRHATLAFDERAVCGFCKSLWVEDEWGWPTCCQQARDAWEGGEYLLYQG
jgi:hypothetical protein